MGFKIYSLMTDKEVHDLGVLLLKPRKIPNSVIRKFGVYEYLPMLRENNLDYKDPDLGW